MQAERGDEADVALFLEGTYPYLPGGVSSWVHQIVSGCPELRFSLVYIGARRPSNASPRYRRPSNATSLAHVYLQDPAAVEHAPDREAQLRLAAAVQRRESRRQSRSRVLRALRRLHLDGTADVSVLADLAAADLPMEELLHGRDAFELITDLAQRLAPDASFLEFFWAFRSMHVPLVHLLANIPIARANCYHAVSTGYAGVAAAAASLRDRRPLVVTEHGIYAREREMELSRAEWSGAAGNASIRRMWSRFFRSLSRLAYAQAARLVTLSEVNRGKELADGALARKIWIIPNGVALRRAPPARAGGGPMRVGFVGRVVPIKDVITFIRACDLALKSATLQVRIIGPDDEDPAYATRCRDLAATLGRTDAIRFVGPLPPDRIYGDLDVLVLTSFSEGQPLVILEAYAAGLPVIATDVGACREMIEGGTGDAALGPSGFVTRISAPAETASALVRLAGDPDLRRRMGAAGRRRGEQRYQLTDMLAAYKHLYREQRGWQA